MPDRDFDEPDFEREWLSLVERLEADDAPPTLRDDPADLGDADSFDPLDSAGGAKDPAGSGDGAGPDDLSLFDDAGFPANAVDDAWMSGDVLDPGAGNGMSTNRQWTPDELNEDDEGSYDPPEPPPLGWLESPPILVLCWIGTVCAPLYALFVVLFWHNAPGYTILLAIGAFIAGVAGLIMSMPDHRDDSDDGAVV